MGLYLLVEKRLRGQRLGNVGLNVDENIRNREEKRRMGLKAFGRRTLQLRFFLVLEKQNRPKKKIKKGWLGRAHIG